MSDYTPTTEQVRDSVRPWHYTLEQFDRWLESTLQETQIAERERIIRLLEDPYSLLGSSIAHWQFGCDNEAKLEAFEIIKGENK